jgi:hypothetical protein
MGHSGLSGRLAGSLACRPSVVSATASVIPSTSVSPPAGQCAYFEWDIRHAASVVFIGGFAALGAGSECQQRSGVAHCTAVRLVPSVDYLNEALLAAVHWITLHSSAFTVFSPSLHALACYKPRTVVPYQVSLCAGSRLVEVDAR